MCTSLRQVLLQAPSVTSWSLRHQFYTQLIRPRNSPQIHTTGCRQLYTITASSRTRHVNGITSALSNQRLNHHVTKSSVPCGKRKTTNYSWGKVPCQWSHTDASFEMSDDCLVARHGDKTFNCTYFWLRDHCRCPECFDVNTYQHLIDPSYIDPSIVPHHLHCNEEGIKIVWPDNHKTFLNWEWLEENGPGQQMAGNKKPTKERVLWDNNTLERVLPPDVRFNDLLSGDEGLKTLLENLYVNGIAFVGKVPARTLETQRVVERIGKVMDTFYGKMWTFTANLAVADSAYTDATLSTHHDTTYFYDPAGLQVLHCLHHKGTGGQNPMVDGFHAADALRRNHPEQFEALCRIPLVGKYVDEKRNLNTMYYTIATNPITHEIEHVRFNNYDRGPLSHLSDADISAYYEAFRLLAEEIHNQDNVYTVKLTPGRVMIFDNWRVLHGRYGFTGKRIMTGCYISRLEYKNSLYTVAGIKG